MIMTQSVREALVADALKDDETRERWVRLLKAIDNSDWSDWGWGNMWFEALFGGSFEELDLYARERLDMISAELRRRGER